LIGEEGTQKSPQDLARQPRIPGTAIAQRIGKSENPLTHRNFAQDMVDERSGCVRHPPATTRRTESTSLAREGNEPIVSTPVAMDTQKSVSEYPALQIRTDLFLHEPGNGRALPSRPSQEGLDLLADDFVEQDLFGFVAFVFDGGRESIGIVRSSALNTKASYMPRRPRREASGGTHQSPARIKSSSRASRRSDAEPPGSHAQRDRVNSSLLIGSRAGAVSHWDSGSRVRLAASLSGVSVVPGTRLDRNTAVNRAQLRSVSGSV
jgi:hypothetical protein